MWFPLLVLLASVLAGAATVLLAKLDQPRHLKLLTAFTGSFLASSVGSYYIFRNSM